MKLTFRRVVNNGNGHRKTISWMMNTLILIPGKWKGERFIIIMIRTYIRDYKNAKSNFEKKIIRE